MASLSTRVSSPSDEPTAKKQKVEASKEELLAKLRVLLQSYHEEYKVASDVKMSVDCEQILTAADLLKVKEHLEERGFVVLKGAISPQSVKEAKVNIGKCVTEMWEETLKDKPGIKNKLLEGNLDCFQPYRNAANGQGNASFGYYYKQFMESSQYPHFQLEGEKVTFDTNPVYAKVNLELISHRDNLHSLAIMMGMTHLHGMISWDSVKYSTNPRPKPKTMTKQTLTVMHIDYYGDEIRRYQAIDNNDQRIKLFFVPGSHTQEVKDLLCEIAGKQFFNSFGHVRLNGISDKLTEILYEYAIAPPPFGRVVWKSGMIHFEGAAKAKPLDEASAFPGCFPCESLKDLPNQTRFRFVIGPHLPTDVSQNSLKRLAIAAERGICPAMYGRDNKDTKVGKNIVNRKTTQYKVPRKCTEEELSKLHQKLTHIPTEGEEDEDSKLNTLLSTEIPSPLKQLLHGIHHPIDATLGFSEDDLRMISAHSKTQT